MYLLDYFHFRKLQCNYGTFTFRYYSWKKIEYIRYLYCIKGYLLHYFHFTMIQRNYSTFTLRYISSINLLTTSINVFTWNDMLVLLFHLCSQLIHLFGFLLGDALRGRMRRITDFTYLFVVSEFEQQYYWIDVVTMKTFHWCQTYIQNPMTALWRNMYIKNLWRFATMNINHCQIFFQPILYDYRTYMKEITCKVSLTHFITDFLDLADRCDLKMWPAASIIHNEIFLHCVFNLGTREPTHLRQTLGEIVRVIMNQLLTYQLPQRSNQHYRTSHQVCQI